VEMVSQTLNFGLIGSTFHDWIDLILKISLGMNEMESSSSSYYDQNKHFFLSLLSNLPIMFGVAVYAFEGIGLVIEFFNA
jgi:hypothetical protein